MEHLNKHVSRREVRSFGGITIQEKVINKSIYKVFVTNDELNLMLRDRIKEIYPNCPSYGAKIEFLEDHAGKTMAVISWQEHKEK